eukprot:26671_1
MSFIQYMTDTSSINLMSIMSFVKQNNFALKMNCKDHGMTDLLSTSLSRLDDIELDTRKKGLLLLLRILNNILSHSSNPKYRDLKCRKVKDKFDKCSPCLDLLFCAGFKKSTTGKRFIWKNSDKNMSALMNVIKYTQLYHTNKTNTQHLYSNNTLTEEKHDKRIVNSLMDLKLATREQCIKASLMTKSKDPNVAFNKLQQILKEDKADNTDEIQCELSKCDAFHRLMMLLNMTTKTDWHQNVSIEMTYDNTSFLNDFHHLLMHHDHQFEQICNTMIEKCNNNTLCDMLKCKYVQRNYRNRLSDTEFTKLYSHCNVHIDQVIYQQILDKLHCYYFHSFDLKHRLRESDKQRIKQA